MTTTDATRSTPIPPDGPPLPDGATVVHDEVVDARAAWSHVLAAGDTLRIVDLGGNQAVDCLFYDAHDPTERYSAADTIAAQRNIFLVPGTPAAEHRGQRDAHRHRYVVRLPRHDRRGVQPGVEHAALRAPHAPPARLRRQLPRRRRPPRPDQARPRVEHQLVHERPGRRRRHAGHRRRHLRARAPRRRPRRARRHRPRVELPADQQPVQRLRPDAGPHGRLPRRRRDRVS